MFSFKSFQGYIKKLCETHKVIAHNDETRQTFFRMDELEKSFSGLSIGKSPFVSIDDAAGYPIGGDEPTALEWSVVIHFLSVVDPAVGNISDSIENAREETFEILFDFWLKICLDYEDGYCGNLGIKYLNRQQMEFAPMGPEGVHEYGWLLRMAFRTFLPVYDPLKWLD
jgi:hypothetical protein